MAYIWKLNIEVISTNAEQRVETIQRPSLMDYAVKDKEMGWNPIALEAINACRLFHGLKNPGDLFYYDLATFKPTTMSGRSSMRT